MLEGLPTQGLEAHLAFLALYAVSALAAVTTGLMALVRPGPSGLIVRTGAAIVSLGSGAAVLLGASITPGVAASAYGPDGALIVGTCAVALTAAGVLASWAMAEPRVAALVAITGGLTGCGLLLQLLLLAAAPNAAEAFTWELRRLATFGAFAGVQVALVAIVGYCTCLRARRLARPLHLLVGLLGLYTTLASMSLVGGANLREVSPMALLLLGALGWLSWLSLRAAALPDPGLLTLRDVADEDIIDRLSRATLRLGAAVRSTCARWGGHFRRIPSRPSAVLVIALLPLALATIALGFGSGDTARDAARVAVGGMAFTPALLVPFVFAPALGLVLGCQGLRARGLLAIGLTMLTIALLVAQKEVGYTGVVAAIAGVAFLTTRGSLLQLGLAGGTGLLGLGLAFELQPVLPWIPFTVRERVMLWLGGAGLHRRGGHLLAADRVTYDLGGFWGLGIDAEPSLNLHRTVNSLDTDFPFAVLGLFGGLPWLLVYIGLFVGFAVILYDLARRQSRLGSVQGAGWRLPLLAGFATVPVSSTVISLSGGLTHLTPFAGVPAAFVSYGSFFLTGLLAILALFVVLGSHEALAQPHRGAAQPSPLAPSQALEALRRPRRPDPWWRYPSAPGLRLAWRRALGRLRLLSTDFGAWVVVLGVLLLGGLWSHALHTRYTDRPQVHVHPGLVDSVRIRPLVPGVWEVPNLDQSGWAGILEEGRTYRLDSLELRYQKGTLSLIGACFPRHQAETVGVRLGFEGLMRTRLPGTEERGQGLAERLGAVAVDGNDFVLPLAPVFMRHLIVKRTGPKRFEITSASPGARFVLYDEVGDPVTAPRDGRVAVTAGWSVGLADDARLRFRLDDEVPEALEQTQAGEVCLRTTKRPVFRWELSRWRDTLIGPPALRRRAPVDRTVDFEFAEDLKRAAEADLVGTGSDGRLWVTPWHADARANWDPLTRRRFRRLFRVRRLLDDDGDTSERLHWVRGFYRNGSSVVRLDQDWEAFAPGWSGELLGLRDPFRFSRALPKTAYRDAPKETGKLLDRSGDALAWFDDAARRWHLNVPSAGALLGYGFPDRGIYGGVIRVFRRLLSGRRVRAHGAEAELTERLLERESQAVGVDIQLTLDRAIQADLATVVSKSCEELRRKALEHGDWAWAPRGRAMILGPEGEIIAASACPDVATESVQSVIKAVDAQRQSPARAAGLDAWQRTTTVGSTAKIGVVVAAAQDPEAHFATYKGGELCIRADGDKANAKRGCFVERGRLTSFQGESIEPIRNYGGALHGGVSTVNEFLVKSTNTAAAYLAGRVGLAGIRGFYEGIDALGPMDLLPSIIGMDPRYAPDIERWSGDPLRAWRARIGELPPGTDTWRTTYDVRLGLSGFSDFSLLHVALTGAIAARDGRHYRPYLVSGLRDLADGRKVVVETPSPLQVIPVQMSRHVKQAMVDTVRRGTAASIKRMVPESLWREMGIKTGTGETTRLQPGVVEGDEGHGSRRRRRKPKTQDHKFVVGFWPASSRNPYVIVAGYEFVSHLDTKVALRTFGSVVESIARHTGAAGVMTAGR
jgi:cell division protein FtsI/penicillin-binding protein 2/cell division protein FtsW (lipid II flippase)